MAKILITVWPLPTHLEPNFAVAEALIERGHEVSFYSGSEAASTAAALGCRFCSFKEVNWPQVRTILDQLVANRRKPFRLRRLWKEFLVDSIPAQLNDLNPLLDILKPDAILCDLAMWAPILFFHEQRPIPVALLSHILHCLLPGPQQPMTWLPLSVGSSVWMRPAIHLLRKVTQLHMRLVPQSANRLRKERGLPPMQATVTEFTGQLPLYMVPSVPELDLNRSDLPPSVEYIGPCLWEQPGVSAAERGDTAKDCPRVVAEEGAFFTPQPTALTSAAKGLGGLGMEVVVVAGKGRDPEQLKIGPAPNVRVVPWTRLAELLPGTDLVITNGNLESVLSSLLRGVPLVIVPCLWDQFESARRVERVGAGVVVSVRQCTPSRLRQVVENVLGDQGFAQKARRCGEILARRRGPIRAAELLETLIESRQN